MRWQGGGQGGRIEIIDLCGFVGLCFGSHGEAVGDRGSGRRGGASFADDAERRRFPGAVAELPERLGREVHALA